MIFFVITFSYCSERWCQRQEDSFIRESTYCVGTLDVRGKRPESPHGVHFPMMWCTRWSNMSLRTTRTPPHGAMAQWRWKKIWKFTFEENLKFLVETVAMIMNLVHSWTRLPNCPVYLHMHHVKAHRGPILRKIKFRARWKQLLAFLTSFDWINSRIFSSHLTSLRS